MITICMMDISLWCVSIWHFYSGKSITFKVSVLAIHIFNGEVERLWGTKEVRIIKWWGWVHMKVLVGLGIYISSFVGEVGTELSFFKKRRVDFILFSLYFNLKHFGWIWVEVTLLFLQCLFSISFFEFFIPSLKGAVITIKFNVQLHKIYWIRFWWLNSDEPIPIVKHINLIFFIVFLLLKMSNFISNLMQM